MFKKYTIWLASLFTAVSLSTTTLALPNEVDGNPLPSLAPMLEQVTPAIVNIMAQGELPFVGLVPDNKLQSGSRSPTFESFGSGVIIDAEQGYILTNAHLLLQNNVTARTITVNLLDGRSFKAELIGLDPSSDLAVLKIPAKNLTAIPLGNSDNIRVGDFVTAIGHPFGLNQTVTSGIVSGLQIDLTVDGLESYIQTDASINPGNSGGALVNLRGELIGINSAIISPNRGNVGIGFAVPINIARIIMTHLIQFGEIHRGFMGIFVQTITPELATALGQVDLKGAMVTQILPGSPADLAGITPGDIIIKANDQMITNQNQVRNLVGLLQIGAQVQLEIIRDSRTAKVTVAIADPAEQRGTPINANPLLSGLFLENFTQQTATQGLILGVKVVNMEENSAAWRAGLRPGHVIVAATPSMQPTPNLDALMQVTKNIDTNLLLQVMGPGGTVFMVLN